MSKAVLVEPHKKQVIEQHPLYLLSYCWRQLCCHYMLHQLQFLPALALWESYWNVCCCEYCHTCQAMAMAITISDATAL